MTQTDSNSPVKSQHESDSSESDSHGNYRFTTDCGQQGRYPCNYVDIVVGGQVGSEGKGAVVAHLIRTGDYGATVRPGSSNAGHTVYDSEGNG